MRSAPDRRWTTKEVIHLGTQNDGRISGFESRWTTEEIVVWEPLLRMDNWNKSRFCKGKTKIEFFKGDFSVVFSGISSKFRLPPSGIFSCYQWFIGGWSWLKMAPSPKCSGVIKMQDLVEALILRSGVVFTSEVGMIHVNRRWKAYLARNKDKWPESEHEEAKC